jgi:two-component system response regulator HupR/HoxA
MKFRFAKDRLRESTDEERSTIMIVDDEAYLRDELQKLLSKEYEIITASDGQEALERLQAMENPGDISLIICDQRMPGMTGVELLKKLAHNQIMPDTLRIILTAFDDKEVILDAINEAHIYKFVMKQFFDPDEFRLAVQRAVEAFYDRKELKKFRDAFSEKLEELKQKDEEIKELKKRL